MSLEGGEIVSLSSQFGDDSHLIEDEWNVLTQTALLVRRPRTFYFFINHQSNPNARVDIQCRRVIARTEIAADEEITLNYLCEPLPKRYLESQRAAYLKPASGKVP